MADLERPIFGKVGGKQVRTLRGIKPGKRFIWFNINLGFNVLFRIASKPYLKKGKWLVKVAAIGEQGGERYRDELDLAEFSIVPDKSEGWWETENCFLRT